MRQFLRKLVLQEKGGVSVVVALCTVVLLGISALVVDVGIAYADRVKINNAVDAAALAGVQELPHDPIAARSLALAYGEKNGLDPGNMVVEISFENDWVEVTAGQTMQSYFSRVITSETSNIRVSARAQTGVVSAVRGAAPLAVEQNSFVYGERYLLKQGADSGFYEYEGPYHTGYFGPLALGGTGASRYEENLKNGFDKSLKVGDVVMTESGNMSNPTKRAIDYRISQDSDPFDPDNVSNGSPRVLIVPIFKDVNNEKDKIKEITIIGFAAFYVEEVLGQGEDNKIYGYFVEYRYDGQIDTDGSAGYYGVRTSKLVQ